jgi:catecholate siderophore receptor
VRNLGIGTALGFGLLTVPAMAQDQFLPGPGSTSQTIIVTGVRDGYQIDATSTATRTPTELNDVPQAVSIITETQIDDQAMRSIADVLRYVPGAVISQGEGHRDQIILRGNSSTADFFVDGLRDDVQYYRGLYNAERIEVLKGPNAMIFGRGGELAAKFLVHRFVHTPDEPQLRRTQNGVAVYRFGQVKALSCTIPERAAGLDVPSKKGVYMRSRM